MRSCSTIFASKNWVELSALRHFMYGFSEP